VPHDRWGEQVTAVVQPVAGRTPDLDDLATFAREQLAGYKAPRELVIVERIERSPAGKADYRWARAVAEGGSGTG
jgi:acyl-CoA synthetase (AMP-forming)/AMP-acid ligase II